MQNFDSTGDYGRIHYVVNNGSGWTDTTLPNYTHDPAIAIDNNNQLYILGHGHPKSPECLVETQMCIKKQNANGSWAPSTLFATPSGSDSYDASTSVKWSAVGWNRSETVEFLFFRGNAGNYNNTSIMYARIDPTGIVTTTPIPSITSIAISTVSNCPQKIIGDADCDGKISLKDFEIWRKVSIGILTTKTADFNLDNIVNYADYIIWKQNFK